MILALALRWVTHWRGTTSWIPALLPILVCLLTAGLFLPFAGLRARRLDRVFYEVEESVPELQFLALSVAGTLLLAAMFLIVTRSKHTTASARAAAMMTAGVVSGLLLHLYFVMTFFPVTNDWSPADYEDRRLVAIRPCRDAMLWIRRKPYARPVGHLDDVWLRFEDPRSFGEPVPAISIRGYASFEYTWLNEREAARLFVRDDDPKVMDCDRRTREERVAPAQWHTLGISSP